VTREKTEEIKNEEIKKTLDVREEKIGGKNPRRDERKKQEKKPGRCDERLFCRCSDI
jgi:hypothetical protein